MEIIWKKYITTYLTTETHIVVVPFLRQYSDLLINFHLI